jgi:hypothetical protein
LLEQKPRCANQGRLLDVGISALGIYRGLCDLSVRFWANWLVEMLAVTYHPELREFRRQVNNITERLSLDALTRLVSEFLQRFSGVSSGSFPISEIRLTRVRQLVRLMKVAARVSPVEPAGLGPYCAARLRPQAAATLTTDEIWLDYASYCKAREWLVYSKGRFLRILPAHIRELFGLTKSHDIKRNGRPKRGFRGLAFTTIQSPVQPPPKS